MRKNQHIKQLRFSLNTYKHKYPKNCPTEMACSLTHTKQSLQYTMKTHLSGPPMPKFEANMNYIPPSPPSSMKQCNKSAAVIFHMELLLIRPRSNLAVVRHHTFMPAMFVLTLDSI